METKSKPIVDNPKSISKTKSQITLLAGGKSTSNKLYLGGILLFGIAAMQNAFEKENTSPENLKTRLHLNSTYFKRMINAQNIPRP